MSTSCHFTATMCRVLYYYVLEFMSESRDKQARYALRNLSKKDYSEHPSRRPTTQASQELPRRADMDQLAAALTELTKFQHAGATTPTRRNTEAARGSKTSRRGRTEVRRQQQEEYQVQVKAMHEQLLEVMKEALKERETSNPQSPFEDCTVPGDRGHSRFLGSI